MIRLPICEGNNSAEVDPDDPVDLSVCLPLFNKIHLSDVECGQFDNGVLALPWLHELRDEWSEAVDQVVAMWRRAHKRWRILRDAWWRLNTSLRVQVDRRARVRADVCHALQTQLPALWAAWTPPGRYSQTSYTRPPKLELSPEFWTIAKPLLLATCQQRLREDNPILAWYYSAWGKELDRRDASAAQALEKYRIQKEEEAEAKRLWEIEEAERVAWEESARTARISRYAAQLKMNTLPVYMRPMSYEFTYFRDRMRAIKMRWNPDRKQWWSHDPYKIAQCQPEWLIDSEHYVAAMIAVEDDDEYSDSDTDEPHRRRRRLGDE
jgi:hypothetical protein